MVFWIEDDFPPLPPALALAAVESDADDPVVAAPLVAVVEPEMALRMSAVMAGLSGLSDWLIGMNSLIDNGSGRVNPSVGRGIRSRIVTKSDIVHMGSPQKRRNIGSLAADFARGILRFYF
jgi:hypothetical protein